MQFYSKDLLYIDAILHEFVKLSLVGALAKLHSVARNGIAQRTKTDASDVSATRIWRSSLPTSSRRIPPPSGNRRFARQMNERLTVPRVVEGARGLEPRTR